MVDKDRLGLFLEASQPPQKTCLVSVTAGAVEGGDLCVDGNVLTEEPYPVGSVLQLSAQRTLGLVAYEQDGIFRTPEVVLQMVADTARFAHTAGREDHFGAVVEIDLLGFLGGDGQADAVEPQGIDPLPHQGGSFFIEAVLVALEEDARGFHRQGTVHIHRETIVPLDHSFVEDLPDGIEHLLGAPHGKGGDHHIAAPVKGPLEHIRQFAHRITGLFVEPVTVGGFDDQIVRFRNRQGVFDQRLVGIAYITAEYDFFGGFSLCQPQFDAGRAQKVANVGKPDHDPFLRLDQLTVVAGTESGDGSHCICGGIDRGDQLFTCPLGFAVLPLGFGFLDVGRIPEHDIAQVAGAGGGIDMPPEAVLIELGQHSRVVNMCMGQKDRLNTVGRDGDGHILEYIDTLFHAAVHQILLAADLQKCAAAGDLVGRSDELDLHKITPFVMMRGACFSTFIIAYGGWWIGAKM